MDPIRGFSLATVVLFSLVLPLAANIWRTRSDLRRSHLRAVWVGQALGALGGLWIIVAPVHPEWGVVTTVIACLACLSVLRRRPRPDPCSQT